ncbi:MAG: sensor histidine kinase [Sphingomicrobium sp.]
MRFDDRLRTVLAQAASDPHDRAIRWRQLVELVARARGDADGDLVDQAIAQIRGDSRHVDQRVRTAAALAVAAHAIPVDLVATFAADRIAIAAPVLAGARLTASEWKRVSAAASDECRDFIASMRSEQEAPAAEERREQERPIPTISDVVARIERLRQSRDEEPSAALPEQQSDEAPALFRWECNESGEIEWVDGAPRGALVGQSIAHGGLESEVDRSVERAFAARAPFHEGVLELTGGGAIGGTWTITGVPAFEPASGRFAGYGGVAKRPGASPQSAQAPAADADSLRELAHEIKTPLNAIIGFAEIIAGEYLGPAESRYRERARDIVDQARLLLTAVEDLDFAAKVRTHEGSSAAELSDCVALAWDEIEREARGRGVSVSITGGEEPARCALSPQLTQRLVERLGLAVIGCAGEGEALTFRIRPEGEFCALEVNRPASLEGADLRPDRNRRASDYSALPLRLVMGLARAAGGDLEASGDHLILRVPKA